VRLWNLAQGTLLATNEIEHSKPTCLTFAPDGNDVACGGIDDLVRVWTPPVVR
jgi:WD40 repeat protein